MIHHDLWEYDNVGPATLGDITVNGRRIKAVMQPNKNGFLYVLDRVTGEPVWPIEERPVPQSTVPGEQASPTQPFPTKPPPFDRQGVDRRRPDRLHAGAAARRRSSSRSTFVLGPLFTPPSLVSDEPGGKQGTLMVPGAWGAGNWNTGAFDPETGMYYAFSPRHPAASTGLAKADASADAEMDVLERRQSRRAVHRRPADHQAALRPHRRHRPQSRRARVDGRQRRRPAQSPAAQGSQSAAARHPSRPAPLVTKTLLFIGEGSDAFGGTHPSMWGRKFRAYDKATGKVIWETELPSGTTGAPMTYMPRASSTSSCRSAEGIIRPNWSRSPFPELRSALQLRDQILEPVVADARALRHAGRDDHVAHLQRRIAHGRRESRLAAFLGEHRRSRPRRCPGNCSKISVNTSRLGGVISRYSP